MQISVCYYDSIYNSSHSVSIERKTETVEADLIKDLYNSLSHHISQEIENAYYTKPEDFVINHKHPDVFRRLSISLPFKLQVNKYSILCLKYILYEVSLSLGVIATIYTPVLIASKGYDVFRMSIQVFDHDYFDSNLFRLNFDFKELDTLLI